MRVIKQGWCTTVQDLGRHGYQHYGVSVSGGMDQRSLIIANRLVGNRDDDAALEITLAGPELIVENDAVIAVAGADLMPCVDGTAVPLWTSLFVKKSGRITFGGRNAGARCYLAVAGGFDVPMRWGSRSTHLSSRTGGMQGRALEAGDRLVSKSPGPHHLAGVGRALPESLRPVYARTATLRILPGPQSEVFTADALTLLTTAPYDITSRSDRMGYRLAGHALPAAREGPFISDGTAMGALQVPQDGQPILLMADRQTTGGYPKIAVVISADLHRAAQLLPGDTVAFTATTLREAQAAAEAQRRELDQVLNSQR